MRSHQCSFVKEPGSLKLRGRIRTVLNSASFEEDLKDFGLPPEKIVNPLLSFLCETDETARWRAIQAIGTIVSEMAGTSMESARIIMRRLIWSLNDESGGIGWGAPEALGEIMARNETLAREYYRILISYIDENGNLLENNELERGVLWGIGRLARSRPELAKEAVGPVLEQLRSSDPVKGRLALWVLSILRPEFDTRHVPESLFESEAEIRVYEDGKFRTYKCRDLALELMGGIESRRIENPTREN